MADLERQEIALGDLLMQQAQWKIQMKNIEDRSTKGLAALKSNHLGKPVRSMRTRKISRNAETLMFAGMNEMLMNEVEKGFPRSELNPGAFQD